MRFLAATSFLLLAACGQGGDLYLPSDPAAQPQPAATAPTAQPVPEEQKKKDAR